MVRPAPVAPPMQARDLIWLVGLGVAARRPVPPGAPLTALKDLAAPAWLPVDEVVTACLREMLRAGALALKDELLHTTGHGMDCLDRLIGLPLDGPRTSLGQVGLRLKLAQLDLVSAGRQRAVLDALILDHRRELALVQIDLGQVWAGPQGRAWLQHDAERLRRDLDILLGLLADEGHDGRVLSFDLAPEAHP